MCMAPWTPHFAMTHESRGPSCPASHFRHGPPGPHAPSMQSVGQGNLLHVRLCFATFDGQSLPLPRPRCVITRLRICSPAKPQDFVQALNEPQCHLQSKSHLPSQHGLESSSFTLQWCTTRVRLCRPASHVRSHAPQADHGP